MVEKKCDCCPVVIKYEIKNGKPTDIAVEPFTIFKSARVQKAVHQLDKTILTTDCHDCGQNCGGSQVIDEFPK